MLVYILFSALHPHHVHLVSCLYMYVHSSYVHTRLLCAAGSTGHARKGKIKKLRGMTQYQFRYTEAK